MQGKMTFYSAANQGRFGTKSKFLKDIEKKYFYQASDEQITISKQHWKKYWSTWRKVTPGFFKCLKF